MAAEAVFGGSALFSGVVPWLIAFENKLEEAVAGGLAFGVVVELKVDFGVGVDGSAGRERLEDCWLELSSLVLRFVERVDSLPVTPCAAARCFFALSILAFSVRDC